MNFFLQLNCSQFKATRNFLSLFTDYDLFVFHRLQTEYKKKAKARVFFVLYVCSRESNKNNFPNFCSLQCVFLACFLNRKHGKLFKEIFKLAHSGELLLSV